LQIARVSGATGVTPRSGEKATRRGAMRAAAASRKESSGASSESGSSTCQPTIASSIRATSSTLRAIGPLTESVSNLTSPGPAATRPGLGRKPTTEQKLAGVRREPPRSEPVASHTSPVASAAAEPPEEPPALRLVFQGLSVSPKTSLKVLAPAPNSGVLLMPMGMPPWVSRRSTMMSERSGTLSAKIGEP
jgi:hypothetical protein